MEDVRLGLLDTRRLAFAARAHNEVSWNLADCAGLMARRAEAYVVARTNEVEATRNATRCSTRPATSHGRGRT